MSMSIESFHNPEKVEFDPTDEEHLAALAYLVFFGRQHATLRFRFNPEQYDTAYEAVLKSFIKHYIPKPVYNRVYADVQMRIEAENKRRMDEARKETERKARLEQMPPHIEKPEVDAEKVRHLPRKSA